MDKKEYVSKLSTVSLNGLKRNQTQRCLRILEEISTFLIRSKCPSEAASEVLGSKVFFTVLNENNLSPFPICCISKNFTNTVWREIRWASPSGEEQRNKEWLIFQWDSKLPLFNWLFAFNRIISQLHIFLTAQIIIQRSVICSVYIIAYSLIQCWWRMIIPAVSTALDQIIWENCFKISLCVLLNKDGHMTGEERTANLQVKGMNSSEPC